jgi:hypothetical protein
MSDFKIDRNASEERETFSESLIDIRSRFLCALNRMCSFGTTFAAQEPAIVYNGPVVHHQR